MSKAPAFQLYAADFYMDTAGWTPVQVGVYVRLLMYEWINGGIPRENSEQGRIAGVDARTMHKMWSAKLAEKFLANGAGMYVNKRLELEREKQNKYRESQKEKGKEGAEKRWGKNIAGAIADPIINDKPDDSSSSSSSSSLKDKRIKERDIPKNVYGEFKNVKLSQPEYEKLLSQFGDEGLNERIENLSQGIASKGYKYKSHYATILSWERKNNPSKQSPGKTFEAGDLWEKIKKEEYARKRDEAIQIPHGPGKGKPAGTNDVDPGRGSTED